MAPITPIIQPIVPPLVQPTIIPPYRGDTPMYRPPIQRVLPAQSRGGLTLTKILVTAGCILGSIALYKYLFTEFPYYNPEAYPLSKGFYDELKSKIKEKYNNLTPDDLKNLEFRYFVTTFADTLQSVKSCYDMQLKIAYANLKETGTCNEKCSYTGENFIFPVHIPGKKAEVHEAAIIYAFAEVTGKDYLNIIEIDGEMFKKIHPELAKQYEMKIYSVERGLEAVIAQIWSLLSRFWAFLAGVFSPATSHQGSQSK